MKKTTLLALLTITGWSVIAQTKAPVPAQETVPPATILVNKVESNGNSLIIPYEKYKLPNGLTVIISEDHSDPVVHVRVTYHVGAARESIGKSGFAHFFEHMMFQGSEHIKDEEHIKTVSEAGGDMNGFTERDFTTYFETMPSNQLETGLWLESDRMGYLLDSLTTKKFETQRSTVKNEKSQNVENQPYAMAFVEYINQILYPSGHPYSWPVIGYVDDLNRASLQDVKNFFLRWYGTNNAVLTITGDVNSKATLALVEKYFGPLKPSPEVKKMRVPLPVLASDQYYNYTDNTYLPLTLMVFPTSARYSKDEPATDLLASMMGEGNNSIFYKNFIKSEKAIQASVGNQSSELAGELQIMVVAFPGMDPSKDFNETEKLIHSTIDTFEVTGITEEALVRAKAKMESRIIDQNTSVFGKAGLLAEWEMYGKTFNLNDEVDRYNKVTKEEIVRVFQKYVKDKKAAFVNVYPQVPGQSDSIKSVNPYANSIPKEDAEYANLKYVKAPDTFNRFIKPTPGPSKAPEIPQYYTGKLKNGMNVIGTTNSETPKVVMLFEMSGGALVFANDPKKADIAYMTAFAMNEGTEKYTTEQISAELEKLGSSISFMGDKENTTVYVECMSKNMDATLKLLEEKLLHPRFAADDFKRLKKQAVEDQISQKKNADASASKIFNSSIYGSTIMGVYSSSKSMDKVTLEDVKAYYKNYYSPSVTNLIIVGDVKEADIMPKLAFLENWKAKEVSIPAITGFPIAEPTQILLIHKDNASQSVIMAGHLSMPYDATGDFFKAKITNFSFGGSFNSRLNLNLREDKGYTYGIRAGFSGTKNPGMFYISASVRTNATDSALLEINKELINFVNKGVTDEDVAYTKSSMLNSDALKFETPMDKANFLSRIAEYNLPKDFTTQQNTVLKNITKADIDKIAKDFMHPDKMVIVVVGNKYLIKKQLEGLGMGKVKEVTVD